MDFNWAEMWSIVPAVVKDIYDGSMWSYTIMKKGWSNHQNCQQKKPQKKHVVNIHDRVNHIIKFDQPYRVVSGLFTIKEHQQTKLLLRLHVTATASSHWIMAKLQVFLLIVSLNVLLCSGSPLATGKEVAVVQGSEGGKREPRQAG